MKTIPSKRWRKMTPKQKKMVKIAEAKQRREERALTTVRNILLEPLR